MNDAIITDFFNASSLMISHESTVVKLLENMFCDTGTLSWWLYELDYGKNFKIGDLTDNGVDIDISTPDKLYDYLRKGATNE